MDRAARLQAATGWIAPHGGRHAVRSYSRWFGVDLTCAIKELTLLGVVLDPRYVAQVQATMAARAVCKVLRRNEAREVDERGVSGEDFDEVFAFIAGRTPAGFAYGIMRDELRAPGHDEGPA